MLDDIKRTMSILSDSVNSIHEREFEALVKDCVQTLNGNGRVIASGLGKNVPICEKFVGTMVSLGLDAAFLHTNSAVHGDLGVVRDSDLVILLTKSGETSESIHLARLLKKRNCIIWLLSFNIGSTLYNEIQNHIIIDLEHEGDMWNILPNNSSVLNLILLQELAISIARTQSVKVETLFANHPGGAIGSLSRRVAQV